MGKVLGWWTVARYKGLSMLQMSCLLDRRNFDSWRKQVNNSLWPESSLRLQPSKCLRDETVGRLFLLAPFVRFIMLQSRRRTLVADGPEGAMLASCLSRLQMWPLGKLCWRFSFRCSLTAYMYMYDLVHLKHIKILMELPQHWSHGRAIIISLASAVCSVLKHRKCIKEASMSVTNPGRVKWSHPWLFCPCVHPSKNSFYSSDNKDAFFKWFCAHVILTSRRFLDKKAENYRGL